MALPPPTGGANPPLLPAVLPGRETSCRRLGSRLGNERLPCFFHTHSCFNLYIVFLFIGDLIPFCSLYRVVPEGCR